MRKFQSFLMYKWFLLGYRGNQGQGILDWDRDQLFSLATEEIGAPPMLPLGSYMNLRANSSRFEHLQCQDRLIQADTLS